MRQISVVVSLLCSTFAWAEETGPAPTYEQALADAKAKGKPLVLEFWASW